MPKNKGIKSEQFDNIGKGINLFTRDTMIDDKESVDGWNCWSVGKNSIAKRPGVVKFAEVAGATAVQGLGTYYNGSTRKLLAMAGGALTDISTGTSVAISAAPASAGTFTDGLRADFCQAGGRTYISNGTDTMRYFDGDTIREQTNGIKGRYMIFYKSCLWLTGNTDSGNYSRLYRSGQYSTTADKIGDYTFDATGNPLATSVYVSKDDGQGLTGFFKHQDYLYPVKERSLWRALVGTDALQLITLEMVDPARGCDSHHSIDTVENDNFMFNEQGVFATGYEPDVLSQIRTNVISLRIDPDLKSIQKSRLDDVEAIFYDNHYYLSYTSGGGTYNDTMKIYDRQRLGWWEFQVADDNGDYIGASCFSEWKDGTGNTELYWGSPTDGSVYYFDDTVKQDPGYTINSSWKSKKYSFTDYPQTKFFLDTILYFGKTPGDITISVNVDGELAKTKDITIGAEGYAGIGIGEIGTFTLGVEGGTLQQTDTGGGDFVKIPINKIGRNIQIIITDSSSTKSWELNAIDFNFKPLNNLFQPNTK